MIVTANDLLPNLYYLFFLEFLRLQKQNKKINLHLSCPLCKHIGSPKKTTCILNCSSEKA